MGKCSLSSIRGNFFHSDVDQKGFGGAEGRAPLHCWLGPRHSLTFTMCHAANLSLAHYTLLSTFWSQLRNIWVGEQRVSWLLAAATMAYVIILKAPNKHVGYSKPSSLNAHRMLKGAFCPHDDSN